MNRILFTLSFAFVLSTFSIACDAQGWVKAGKAVSKQAAKALKSSKKRYLLDGNPRCNVRLLGITIPIWVDLQR